MTADPGWNVSPIAPNPSGAPVGSPDWWLGRLFARLMDRRADVLAADRWYSGDHPVPAMYQQALPRFKVLLDMTQTNFMQLVVDAAHERMFVEGFRNEGKIVDEPWAIWQGNNFDAGSAMVFQEALALGSAAVLVSPEVNPAGFPTLTPEHPEQTIVEYRPGSQVRAAGLKVWHDDWHGLLMATVYLPDRIDTYAAERKTPETVTAPRWEHQPEQSGPHELGEVPLVDFPNRPRMLKPGTCEFLPVLPIQRRTNRTILDRLVNQDRGAFKQKWATGLDVETDPETGQPLAPFKADIDRLFVAESELARFGQFEPEDIARLLDAVASDVKHIAAIVPTPAHYLLGEVVNISAEALKATEAGLVSRTRRHMRDRDEPVETVARLSLKAAGLSVPNASGMQTIWRNPEFRTEGELVDALVKMRGLGVPLPALWERWGATPQEIEDWKAQQTEADSLANLTSMLNQQSAPDDAPADDAAPQ